jgi:hypothetical protein
MRYSETFTQDSRWADPGIPINRWLVFEVIKIEIMIPSICENQKKTCIAAPLLSLGGSDEQ